MTDEEDPRGVVVISADPPPVLVDLVVRVGLAGWIRPPAADVRLEQPLPDAREVRLGQRREVVLRRTGRGRAARGARASAPPRPSTRRPFNTPGPAPRRRPLRARPPAP